MDKIVFLDVDGTLVDYENRIPLSAVKAIRLARQNGHRIYICTGRSRAEIITELWDIGLDGMIGGNGSYVEDHGQVIFHQTLTLQQCIQVVDWLHKRELAFYLECNDGLFASEGFETAALPAIQRYMSGTAETKLNMITVDNMFPSMIYGGNLQRPDVNKVSFVLGEYQDYLDAAEAFPYLHSGTWGGKGELALFGDLGVKNISKVYAIRVLLNHLGVEQGQTIALGDAAVDIPMLDYCACGVAMGNSSEEVKKAASFVTDNVRQDGLWNAFVKLQLI